MLRQLLLLLTIALFFSGIPSENHPGKEIKVLYIGNSLTYVNDLPGLVAEIAQQDGISIAYESFLFPDYSLEDHWKEGKVKKDIEKEGYDFVIAQQGPSALPESQVLLADYTMKLAKHCKKYNSKLGLYMVWPSKARLFDLDNVISSYSNAAQKSEAMLCPAGLAWKKAWEKDSSIALYGPDNFHPGIAGSLLAALSIYGALNGKDNFDFLALNKLSCKNQITAQNFNILKQCALAALIRRKF
jgi:hypothetical protein